jgi:exoribonuclease R
MARYASRASSDYHTYQFFRERQNEKQSSVITSISESTVTIMLVKYGLECKYELDPSDCQQTLTLNKGQGIFHRCCLKGQERKLFDKVEVRIKVEMQGFHKKVSIEIL